ncbi:MAG: serine/threonine-protein kinase [Cyclobacteriaceae bacterium]
MRATKGTLEKLGELFHELTQLTERDKISRLSAISKENPNLFNQLNVLLEFDKTSHPLFHLEPGGLFSMLASEKELLGTRIGAFELKEIVGQGAMGTVFKAHRVDGQFDQVVAIKLMKPLMNLAFRSFFERERQILAKLNHPNIARLYDGGFTEDERPFFTMEWVSGHNLLDYCRIHQLGLAFRLKLFDQVCQAVRYAHQSLIAHLDLKPQNISINEDGQVKLLDFGISQMLEEDSEHQESFTLAYASPEQILRNHPNTVSDIYSLGVILFELLHDQHPFASFLDDPQALKNAVFEGKGLAFKFSEKFRNTSFAGDLGRIVHKAMAVNPSDRYASVDELIRDLNDFQKDYPVKAHPKSWSYNVKKYIVRNRVVLAVVNAAFLVLLGVGLYYTFQLRDQRNIAQAEAKRANQITGLITDVFSAADPNIGGADTITAVQLLDEGLKNLKKNLGEDPALFADMLLRLGPVYLSLGHYEKGKDAIEHAYTMNLKLPDTSVETLARNEILISSAYFMYGIVDSSVYYSEKAVSRLIESGIRDEELLSSGLLELGSAFYEMANYQKADSVLTAGLRLSRLADPSPNVELATLLHMKGATARKLDYLDSARKYLTESLEMKRQLFDEPHLEIAYTYNFFGSFYQDIGDYEKALDYVKKSLEQREAILGSYHVETVASMGNLARTYSRLGKHDESIPLYKTAISVIDSIFGQSHYYYGALNGSLGNVYYAAGDLKNSAKVFEINRKIFDERLSEKDPRKASPRIKLGRIAMDEGRFEDAKRLFSESLAIRSKLLPEGDILIAQSQQALGESLLAIGDFSTAVDYFEEALFLFRSASEPDLTVLGQINSFLVETYRKMGDEEKANYYENLLSARE